MGPPDDVEVSDWKPALFCPYCSCEFENQTYMYNNGVCPHCGHSSSGTVCDYKVVPRRYVATYVPNMILRLLGWKCQGYYEYRARDEVTRDLFKALI
jgi:hypothetical protein